MGIVQAKLKFKMLLIEMICFFPNHENNAINHTHARTHAQTHTHTDTHTHHTHTHRGGKYIGTMENKRFIVPKSSQVTLNRVYEVWVFQLTPLLLLTYQKDV